MRKRTRHVLPGFSGWGALPNRVDQSPGLTDCAQQQRASPAPVHMRPMLHAPDIEHVVVLKELR
jgi:hypothetical protein